MAKRYSIGGNRYVVVKKQDNEICVTIVDEKSEKSATLAAKRWAQFVAVMYQIDESLTQLLTNQYVKYNFHLGGAWCVSVTTGFRCVDIRKWYYNCSLRETKPTKTGIALRLSEWNTLKELVHQNPSKASGAGGDTNVFVSTRPLQSGGRSIVSRMSSLSVGRNVMFDERVTVYEPNDWPPHVYREARKGHWMRDAADRRRFERRIVETERRLGNIFTDNHRNRIKCRFM